MSKKTIIEPTREKTKLWDSNQEKESPLLERREKLTKESEKRQSKRQAASRAKQKLEKKVSQRSEKANQHSVKKELKNDADDIEIQIVDVPDSGEVEGVDDAIARIDKEFADNNPELDVKKKTVSQNTAEIAFNSLPDNYKTTDGVSIGKLKKGCVGVKDGKLIKRWHTPKTIKLICQRVDSRGITLERLRGFIKL